MRYQEEAQGNWGSMLETATVKMGTEMLTMGDGHKLFLRSWRTDSSNVLLVLHGLGAHSGWFIDLGNSLASRHLTIYAVDHRGFGRSDGLAGHIDNYHTYTQDIAAIVTEIRTRHPTSRIFVLGHSMGGIFATHLAAQYGQMLAGVIFLNPWVQDTAQLPMRDTLSILLGGLLKSQRAWRTPGGHENMTANPEAVRMLEADPFWRRSLTATFLVQILFMRLAVLKLAKKITLPALVLQAETDKSVRASATRTFYEALGSSAKTWVSYTSYYHDTELEDDHSQLDDDIVSWIQQM